MSFPRYPEYKDSGVEWLGAVPAHWDVSPLKYLARVGNGSTPNREQLAYWADGTYPWLNSSAVNQEVIKESDQFVTELALNDCHLPKITPPAVLIGITGQGRTRGMAALLTIEATISQHVAYVSPDAHKASVEWIRRIFDANYRLLRDESDGGGSTKGAITCEQISTLKIPIPSMEEQISITAFLARETEKLDELVTEQQRLIELLKEKREAVISHAATKGLNPDAPMKPSGVEWLGEVPSHWRVGKCGYYVSILSGFAFPSGGFSENPSHHKLLRGVNIGVGALRWDDVVHWERQSEDGLDEYELLGGELVIGMDRPHIAEGVRVARVRAKDLPSLLLQRVASVRCRDELHIDYLETLFASSMFVAHFVPETTGVSVPHISPGQIRSFVVPIPPLAEQVSITVHIAEISNRYAALIQETELAVSLLEERRTALISAAVTGQIDVRAIAGKAAA
ncbi:MULTISPECIES: restriction endonuclease subunit S [unclassified Corallococcus]|uniref:restriction endonuclease subunit S n=1 Tax=unclassified Corallococcus TaxID=2685029 RepID=UPI001A8CD431|nr:MULTISPECIES: restriction endonuclease subunit S [unclassified Corallococcus]MBN9688414.1 restriction endonuclease subunit S [Corallococcus sp. NCSPR001]WAS87786.1 restriction endonuclease subunit S [Corallococcus sp. NCRR]